MSYEARALKPHPLYKLFNKLLELYGPQFWWPAQSPFEVMVGAILTQNTSWTNVEKAIANLSANDVLSAEAILEVSHEQLAAWIMPAGYFNVKARRLKNYCRWYIEQGGYQNLLALETNTLRMQLLAVNGIGAETADDILLYAFAKPVFVIDAYTRRLLQRLGFIKGNEKYETLRRLMESVLPADPHLFNEYHALIVKHAKVACRKKPLCGECALSKHCLY